MTAPPDQSQFSEFESAFRRANAWRAECIQKFAELELMIAEALQCLSEAKPNLKIKRGGQIRQSFDKLKRFTGPKGSRVEFVARSLSDIEDALEWHAHLTHGFLSVWQGNRGQWLLTFEHRDRSDGPVRMYPIGQKAAEDLLVRISVEVDRFRKRITSMRVELQKKAP